MFKKNEPKNFPKGPNDPSVTRESPGLQTEMVNKKLEIMQQFSPNKVVPLSQASLLSEEH